MASIFNALHIGYSGLDVAQKAVSTTSHNVSNAESEGYTRQRVVAEAATPINLIPGQVGNGAEVTTIKRVFDNFVFDKYASISATKEYSDFETKTLDTLSTYFPEIDGVGIKADLQKYYDMWQSLSDNPENDAVKVALGKQAEQLTKHITQTQEQVIGLQSQINEELAVNIKEVNTLAKELSSLNLSINVAEMASNNEANDLRDRRNVIEKTLSQLIGSDVSVGQIESNMKIDSSSNTTTGSYTLSVNGFNIVDGASYHPLVISNTSNANGFYNISYERQDGVLIPMEEELDNGKIGSILNLRGGVIDAQTGMPQNGVIQNVINEMNSFAKGLIQSTNNLYAQSSTTRMDSNILDTTEKNPILSSGLNVKAGSFNVLVYDIDGNIAASRAININNLTTMGGVAGSNSIEGQMSAQIDDNSDGNANNDIDNFLNYNWASTANGNNSVEFTMNAALEAKGYTFAIQDNLKDASFSSGTNFAGALGLSRFFDGDSAKNIALNFQIKADPQSMSAAESTASGDHKVALQMIQQQFENYDFEVKRNTNTTTLYGMFDVIATNVGIASNIAKTRNDTISTQFNSVEMEYSSVSKVNIDEEMTNLIKYQTSYGAAAKVITTIDQMMQTLLGIKQ